MKVLLKDSHHQTLTEEIANAITHGLGVALSIAALVLMVVFSAKAGHTTSVVSCSIFGSTLILLYTSSTFYHAAWHRGLKRLLKVVDHIMIYMLIAGTYTPFMLVGLGDAWGWSLFGVIWGLALMGMVFKLFFTGKFEKLSVSIYIAMGWLAIIAIHPIYKAIPLGGIVWLLAGGCAYTLGTVFYMLDHKIRYTHTMWHLFVLAGSLCHITAVFFYIVP